MTRATDHRSQFRWFTCLFVVLGGAFVAGCGSEGAGETSKTPSQALAATVPEYYSVTSNGLTVTVSYPSIYSGGIESDCYTYFKDSGHEVQLQAQLEEWEDNIWEVDYSKLISSNAGGADLDATTNDSCGNTYRSKCWGRVKSIATGQWLPWVYVATPPGNPFGICVTTY